jgi:hypothetical protein
MPHKKIERGYSVRNLENKDLYVKAKQGEAKGDEIVDLLQGVPIWSGEKFSKDAKDKLIGRCLSNYDVSSALYEEIGDYKSAMNVTKKELRVIANMEDNSVNKKYEQLQRRVDELNTKRNERIMDYKSERKLRGGLEGVEAVISILSLVGGLLFLSGNFTGNVVGNLTNSSGNLVGVCLIVVGLIAGAFCLRK